MLTILHLFLYIGYEMTLDRDQKNRYKLTKMGLSWPQYGLNSYLTGGFKQTHFDIFFLL
jgi:hypothetical protein